MCILGVPLIGTLAPEVCRQYSAAALKIPAPLWTLVQSIEVGDADSTGKAWRDGRIRIPADFHGGQLFHEVAHLVSWAHDDALLQEFSAKFWPGGKPKGQPASDYAARQGAAEDFAETGRRLWRGDRGTTRISWLKKALATP